MEPTNELGKFLKLRRNATDAGAVVFENNPASVKTDAVKKSTEQSGNDGAVEKVFENCPETSVASARNEAKTDSTVLTKKDELRSFWKKQASCGAALQLPNHRSGANGLSLTPNTGAGTFQRPSKCAFPLIPPAELPNLGNKHEPTSKGDVKGFNFQSNANPTSFPQSPKSTETTESGATDQTVGDTSVSEKAESSGDVLTSQTTPSDAKSELQSELPVPSVVESQLQSELPVPSVVESQLQSELPVPSVVESQLQSELPVPSVVE
eukprot:Selendium_serpulae@DN6004_c1_g1_i5.p1